MCHLTVCWLVSLLERSTFLAECMAVHCVYFPQGLIRMGHASPQNVKVGGESELSRSEPNEDKQKR